MENLATYALKVPGAQQEQYLLQRPQSAPLENTIHSLAPK